MPPQERLRGGLRSGLRQRSGLAMSQRSSGLANGMRLRSGLASGLSCHRFYKFRQFYKLIFRQQSLPPQ